MSDTQSEDFAEDLVTGADKIGKVIDANKRRAYHLLETGQIPAGKIGGRWVASRRKLRAHYDRLTDGASE